MKQGHTRELLAEVLHTMLSHGRGKTLKGLAIGFVVWLTMETFAHASATAVEYLVDPFIGKGYEKLSLAFWHMVMPALLLAAVITGVWWWIMQAASPKAAPESARKIRATRGLITNLSAFKGSGDLATIEALEGRMNESISVGPSEAVREKLLCDLYRTNWGPLAAAVSLHWDNRLEGGTRLETCWLITTKASRGAKGELAEHAKDVIRLLTMGTVQTNVVELNDQNSVEEMLSLVESIYSRAAAAHNLDALEVTADMTGGTAAMTAGMVLATLDDSRPLQYLTQPASLLDETDRPLYGEALRKVLRPVPTSPRMVAQAFGRFLARTAGSEAGEAGH